MTVHTWTTSLDAPPAAWSALVTDVTTLLTSWESVGKATVAGPAGTGPAQLDADTIAFTVTLPGKTPLSITFARVAGTGSTTTAGVTTDGLVVVALARAARHLGALFTWTSEAGTTARAVAAVYGEHLFADGDRALLGQPPRAQAPDDPAVLAAGLCARAVAQVTAGPATLHALDTIGFLAATITVLQAEHDGRVAATNLLTPPPPVAARSWFAAPRTP